MCIGGTCSTLPRHEQLLQQTAVGATTAAALKHLCGVDRGCRTAAGTASSCTQLHNSNLGMLPARSSPTDALTHPLAVLLLCAALFPLPTHNPHSARAPLQCANELEMARLPAFTNSGVIHTIEAVSLSARVCLVACVLPGSHG